MFLTAWSWATMPHAELVLVERGGEGVSPPLLLEGEGSSPVRGSVTTHVAAFNVTGGAEAAVPPQVEVGDVVRVCHAGTHTVVRAAITGDFTAVLGVQPALGDPSMLVGWGLVRDASWPVTGVFTARFWRLDVVSVWRSGDTSAELRALSLFGAPVLEDGGGHEIGFLWRGGRPNATLPDADCNAYADGTVALPPGSHVTTASGPFSPALELDRCSSAGAVAVQHGGLYSLCARGAGDAVWANVPTAQALRVPEVHNLTACSLTAVAGGVKTIELLGAGLACADASGNVDGATAPDEVQVVMTQDGVLDCTAAQPITPVLPVNCSAPDASSAGDMRVKFEADFSSVANAMNVSLCYRFYPMSQAQALHVQIQIVEPRVDSVTTSVGASGTAVAGVEKVLRFHGTGVGCGDHVKWVPPSALGQSANDSLCLQPDYFLGVDGSWPVGVGGETRFLFPTATPEPLLLCYQFATLPFRVHVNTTLRTFDVDRLVAAPGSGADDAFVVGVGMKEWTVHGHGVSAELDSAKWVLEPESGAGVHCGSLPNAAAGRGLVSLQAGPNGTVALLSTLHELPYGMTPERSWLVLCYQFRSEAARVYNSSRVQVKHLQSVGEVAVPGSLQAVALWPTTFTVHGLGVRNGDTVQWVFEDEECPTTDSDPSFRSRLDDSFRSTVSDVAAHYVSSDAADYTGQTLFTFSQNTAVDAGLAVVMCYRFGLEQFARLNTTIQVFGPVESACVLPGVLNATSGLAFPCESSTDKVDPIRGVLGRQLAVQVAGTPFSGSDLASGGNAGVHPVCSDAFEELVPLPGSTLWSTCSQPISDERCVFLSSCIASCNPPQVLFEPDNSQPLVFDNMQQGDSLDHWVKVDLGALAHLTGVVVLSLSGTGPSSFRVQLGPSLEGPWVDALVVPTTVSPAGESLLVATHVFGPMSVIGRYVRLLITAGLSSGLTTLTALRFHGRFVNATTATDALYWSPLVAGAPASCSSPQPSRVMPVDACTSTAVVEPAALASSASPGGAELQLCYSWRGMPFVPYPNVTLGMQSLLGVVGRVTAVGVPRQAQFVGHHLSDSDTFHLAPPGSTSDVHCQAGMAARAYASDVPRATVMLVQGSATAVLSAGLPERARVALARQLPGTVMFCSPEHAVTSVSFSSSPRVGIAPSWGSTSSSDDVVPASVLLKRRGNVTVRVRDGGLQCLGCVLSC